MSINYDDPKWTAYVLGELSETERARLDSELESSEEAREFVHELRHAASLVKEGLAARPDASLTPEQRRSVRRAALTPPVKRWFPRALAWASGLAIAFLMIASIAIPSLLRSRQAGPDWRPNPAISNVEPVDIPAVQETPPPVVTAKKVKNAEPPAAQAAHDAFALVAPVDPIAQAELKQEPANAVSGVAVRPFRLREAALPAAAPPPPPADAFDRATGENPFLAAAQQPLATFSVDVDTASYANVRRFLTQNQWPPRDSVRLEEMINYFTYEYPQGAGGQAVTGSLEVAVAPWNPQHRLVRVGVKAKDVRLGQKPSNLVFLIDVSGSMGTPERLPLLKNGLRLLVEKLTENDRVSIVTYAGASGIALPPISGDRKDMILRTIDRLQAEGSTNGGAGIQTAYELAVSNFIPGGVNRVILATDGDFNVGLTDQNALTRLIEDKARSGVFLTVLGVGNNFKDTLLGRLAEKGHGNYAFIDTANEARKVLVEQIDATLVAVAKDVKVQVEFNPAQVNAYRLLGYESRIMAAQDFNNDRKDANDMGSGQTVTALFEVVPHGVEQPLTTRPSNELLHLRIRYKDPEGSESKLIETPLIDRGTGFSNAGADFRFASAVAGFGMILRDSAYKGSATLDWVLATAQNSRGVDKNGYRDEFVRLVQRAMQIRR